MANMKVWLCLFLICVSLSCSSASRPLQQRVAKADGVKRGRMMREAEKVFWFQRQRRRRRRRQRLRQTRLSDVRFIDADADADADADTDCCSFRRRRKLTQPHDADA
ncbi:Uncharacterized protein Rs2_40024 [Raphanus sativus]|nr:Uncharacterized protein Rs2_40024 [Raphanus sativus]